MNRDQGEDQRRRPAFPYLRYVERGYRYAHALLRNVDDAEETVQEAFCRLVEANGSAPRPEDPAFEPTFFKVVRNLSIDRIRKNARRDHEPLDEAVHGPTIDAVPDEEPLEARLASLSAELPENQLSALELRVNAGLGYDAIAEVMDVTTAQVRTWIFRARRHLRCALEKAGAWPERTAHGQP